MDFTSITRELHIEASPQTVYDVVSRPEHISEWWADEATLDGDTGQLTFGSGAEATVAQLTVLEALPPTRFVFRWNHPAGSPAAEANSFLVTFELEPSATGTTVRFSETGFTAQGFEPAVVEETYADHARAWQVLLPRLQGRSATLGVPR